MKQSKLGLLLFLTLSFIVVGCETEITDPNKYIASLRRSPSQVRMHLDQSDSSIFFTWKDNSVEEVGFSVQMIEYILSDTTDSAEVWVIQYTCDTQADCTSTRGISWNYGNQMYPEYFHYYVGGVAAVFGDSSYAWTAAEDTLEIYPER